MSTINPVEVVTYNILARQLCSTTNFKAPNYDEQYLTPEYRYSKIWANLDTYITNRYIICLQEVDAVWSGQFQVDFESLNYNFYFHGYGRQFNNYMGVAIAVPRELKVTSIDRHRMADSKEWPKHDQNEIIGAKWMKFLSGGYIDYTARDYYVWRSMRDKWNFMLTVCIEQTDGQMFFVGTLHMPCSFRHPSIMLTYTALAMQHIQQLAGQNKYILAGDFNFDPDCNCYQLITTGHINDSILNSDYIPEDSWRISQLELSPMTSAIKQCQGQEPTWTNYALNNCFGSDTTAFKATIDYIFISSNWKVIDSFANPPEDCALCPNKDHPSDHMLIWSQLGY